MAILIIVFSPVTCYSQTDRIQEIRNLYKNYNDDLSGMDSYDIKLNTAGSNPSVKIYKDYEGKVMIKTRNSYEFGGHTRKYYFLNDTIQFILSRRERLLTHWSKDTLKHEMLELRFYFDKGQRIKSIKKHYKGETVKGQEKKPEFSELQGKTIEPEDDLDVNWRFYNERITQLMQLYTHLEQIFPD